MPARRWQELISQAAATFRLRADVLTAQVYVESGGNAYAWNPEPAYRYLWDVKRGQPFRILTEEERTSEIAPADFPTLAGDRDQEFWAQQASWGLLQVMGALARERHFTGPYLTELVDPLVNIGLAAGHLSDLVVWAQGDYTQALAAYNGGRGGNTHPPFRNQAYADRVFTELRKRRLTAE